MLRNLKTLKIDAETHRKLSHMATDLDLPMGDLATAILEAALAQGPKPVWKIATQAGLTARHDDTSTRKRLANLFRLRHA
ncbi:hypothetical protein CBM2598_U70009 [Cupriavidus taiwanensis]|nr:hypothetical protein CBM2598_U70009 [Cupriavidus taiwanensis]